MVLDSSPRRAAVVARERLGTDGREQHGSRPLVDDDGGGCARQAAHAQLPRVAAIEGHEGTVPRPDVHDLRVARIERIRPQAELRPGDWERVPGPPAIGAASEAIALLGA